MVEIRVRVNPNEIAQQDNVLVLFLQLNSKFIRECRFLYVSLVKCRAVLLGKLF